jgi:hypothetical protein
MVNMYYYYSNSLSYASLGFSRVLSPSYASLYIYHLDQVVIRDPRGISIGILFSHEVFYVVSSSHTTALDKSLRTYLKYAYKWRQYRDTYHTSTIPHLCTRL